MSESTGLTEPPKRGRGKLHPDLLWALDKMYPPADSCIAVSLREACEFAQKKFDRADFQSLDASRKSITSLTGHLDLLIAGIKQYLEVEYVRLIAPSETLSDFRKSLKTPGIVYAYTRENKQGELETYAPYFALVIKNGEGHVEFLQKRGDLPRYLDTLGPDGNLFCRVGV